MSERNVERAAIDYGRLSAADFDAKYPGWYEDEDFMSQLRAWFVEQGHVANPQCRDWHGPCAVCEQPIDYVGDGWVHRSLTP